MTQKQDKAKIVVSFNSYKQFVINTEDALKVLELLKDAERYEAVYHSSTPTKESHTTAHVYPHDDDDELVTFRHITNAQYALAKIAGKPVKDRD